MKKFLVPVAVGVVVFGGVTAFAATLNVSSTSLGAGDTAVASCNSSAHVDYTTGNTGATNKSYQVSAVTVTTVAGVSPADSVCSGKAFKVTLTKSDGTIVGSELTGTLGTDGSKAVTLAAPVAASDIAGVSVVITG